MRYEFWIGSRYAGLSRAKGRGRRRAKRGDRFVSFIAASSMTGIALGVAALIVVLSVMNGFQRDVRDRMLSVLPHIELYDTTRSPAFLLREWQAVADLALADSEVQAAAPFVAAQAMVARGQQLSGVQIRGVEPDTEMNVSDVASQMVQGALDELQAGSYHIVLGSELAATLRAYPGDTVMVLAPQGSVSPAGFTPRMR